jgi:hypothetical protein
LKPLPAAVKAWRKIPDYIRAAAIADIMGTLRCTKVCDKCCAMKPGVRAALRLLREAAR